MELCWVISPSLPFVDQSDQCALDYFWETVAYKNNSRLHGIYLGHVFDDKVILDRRVLEKLFFR